MSRIKICTCCGRYCYGEQWWNQDLGYGLCSNCIKHCMGEIEHGHESRTYGKEGKHYFKDMDKSNVVI